MLSKKLHEAMNAQINAELWSAYLYLSMSMDAEAKGLKGIANWFYVQFREEQDHARIFMNYILSRDAEVKLLPIEAVRTEWASPLEMFRDTLEHEKKVTAMIGNLAAIAAEDKDFPVVIGVSEIENRSVMEDVIAQPKLAHGNYRIVHYDSPDARGVDVGFYYRPDVFKLEGSAAIPFKMPEMPNFKTRDFVTMWGTIENEPFFFLVSIR